MLKIVLICVGVGIAVSASVGWLANGTVGSLKDGIRLVFRNPRRRCPLACRRLWFRHPDLRRPGPAEGQIEQKDAVWNPFSCPPCPTGAPLIKRSDSVVGIVFMLIFGGLLIFAPQVFGAWVKEGRRYGPFRCSIWISGITMPLMLLGLGIALVEKSPSSLPGGIPWPWRFSTRFRAWRISLSRSSCSNSCPFLNPDFAGDLRAAYGWSSFSPGDLLSHWDTALIPNILLAVITAATLIDIGVTTYRAVRYSESAL